MELKEIEAIKEGSFKKITVQYFHQEKESQINCIVLGLTDDQRLAVYTEEGAINNLYPKIIKKITITKSLTPEARTIMKDFYIQHKKFCKEMKVYDEKRQAYNQLYHLNETKLPEAMGYLTEAGFINIVMKNLPPIVKSDLESSGYKTEIHKYNNPILEFSYWKDLIKNFRRGSFVYEEYDGTIHMTEDCEKNKDYQRLIRLNRHPIRLKIKPEEYLSLGDKDWLSYHCSYSVKLTKPLTKEYAIEIAKKIS